MKKLIYFFAMVLLGITMSACGSDKNDGGNSSVAWTGTTYTNGTTVGIGLTFDSKTTGTLRLHYNGLQYNNAFSYDQDGDTYEIRFYGSGSGRATLVINGSSASYYSGDGVYNLSKSSLHNYYQEWYDEVVSDVIYRYNESLQGGWKGELQLQAAKDSQKKLVYIHNLAESEGVSLNLSEWETKYFA